MRRTKREIREIAARLLAKTPKKLADISWGLPSIFGLFLVLWAGIAFIVGGPQPLAAITVGILVACCLFLTILAVLQIPLRRQTREIYPHAEHLYAEAHHAHDAGKLLAATTAAEKEAEMAKQRDIEIQASERCEQERFEAIDQANPVKEAAERKRLEQELQAIRQQFEAELRRHERPPRRQH